ncbi:glycosyltransferase family 4 protein [soil metagenome]
MNICLVNNLFPPINTGSSHYTRDLAVALNDQGHKVIVITNESEGHSENEFYQNSVKVYRLKVRKLPKLSIWMKFPDFNFSLTPSNAGIFRQILIDEKIDIIHQCNNIFDLIFFSAHYAKKLKIPLFCSLTTPVQHTTKFYNSIITFFDKTIIKWIFSSKVSMYIALDTEVHRYISERYGRKINQSIIPFSIPDDSFTRSLYDVKRDYQKCNYRMVSLGHISAIKNRRETLKAWKIVIEKFPNAKIRIVGDLFSDEIKDLIKELGLEDNIELTGRIPHKDIIDHLHDVDFGCMFMSEDIPYNKAIGTANLELMAAGLPVIVDADNKTFGEDFPLINGKHLITIEKRTPEYLSSLFISLFEDAEKRNTLGTNGRDFVNKTITWKKLTDVLLKKYKEYLN